MSEVKLKAGFRVGDYNEYEVLIDVPINMDVKNSFADVFLTKKTKTGKMFALKVLRPERVKRHSILLKYFKSEIEILKKLDHQNIVKIEDYGTLIDLNGVECYYLMMEYIEGKLQGDFSVKDYVKFAMQICDGLYYLHKNNIIHRDIKPDNILLYSINLVKIADFGIARLFEKGTDISTQVGSPPYAAPEQMSKPDKITPRSDIYSLGKTIYYLITKEIPQPGEPINRLPEKFQNYSWCKPLEHILAKATQSKPELRFKDAFEFKIALSKVFRKSKVKKKSVFRDKKIAISFAVASIILGFILVITLIFFNKNNNIPSNPEELKQEAKILFSLGTDEYPTVIEKLNDYLNYNSNDTEALFYLGWIYFQQGFYAKSEKVFKKLIDKYPKEIGGRIVLGKIYYGKGEKERALQIWKKVLEIDKHNVQASALIDGLEKEIFK